MPAAVISSNERERLTPYGYMPSRLLPFMRPPNRWVNSALDTPEQHTHTHTHMRRPAHLGRILLETD